MNTQDIQVDSIMPLYSPKTMLQMGINGKLPELAQAQTKAGIRC